MRYLLIALILLTKIAFAQETVSDLLAQEGKKLSADEIKSLAANSNMKFKPQMNGMSIDAAMKLSTDGKLTGTFKTPMGNMPTVGTWEISTTGQLCTTFGMLGNTMKRCNNIYQAKTGKYFTALAESDGSSGNTTKLEAREFEQ